MSCKSARVSDQYHGWECSITDGACMFLLPDSKKCAEIYGEGPDAHRDKCEDCKNFYMKDGKRCCKARPYFPVFEGDPPKTDFLEDGTTCCGGFERI